MSRLVFFTNGSNEQSAYCWGNRIAERMGMPIDIPFAEIRPDDMLMFIKCSFKNIDYIVSHAKKVFFVVGCGWRSFHKFVRPKITLVMTTPRARDVYRKYYPNNEVIWIPLAHSNYENLVRPLNRPVKKIVFSGTRSSFPDKEWAEFKQKIEAKGFEIVRAITPYDVPRKGEECRVFCRDLWLNNDIAVSFRRTISAKKGHVELRLKPPNKLHGAGSVMVPSVAYPEVCFKENYDKPGCFLPANTIDEMVEQCCRLRDDKGLYAQIATQAYNDASPYHIDKIIPYYEELLCE